jgi:hypothetical protein
MAVLVDAASKEKPERSSFQQDDRLQNKLQN